MGSGHVMRCLTLAQALRERGAQAAFVSLPQPGDLRDEILRQGFPLLAGLEQADWLVVDHYGLDAAWESDARGKAARILAIDDLANRRHDCDVLLDQNFFPDAETRYGDLAPSCCRRLLGPRYALLRPEFSELRKRARRDGAVRRILVSFGGVDAANETAKAIAAIRALAWPGLEVDVVIGAASPHADEIACLCALPPPFRLHRQAQNMAELMAAADLALGAGGSTTWERCCLGLPALQVAIAPNQEAPSQALAEVGLVTYLGRGSSLTAERLREALAAAAADPSSLRRRSSAMRALVDGEGRRRVAAAMLAGRQSALKMRSAQAADADLYFEWANDPEVRRQSLESRPIGRAGHERWFAARLSDAALFVAEDEAGLPVGQVRFERDDARWRINYSVGAEFRGAGLAAKMLGLAIEALRRRHPQAQLKAEVKTGNLPSRKVFLALGFREVSDVMFELDR